MAAMTIKHEEELFTFLEEDLRRVDDDADDEGLHIVSGFQGLLERFGKTPRALCGVLLTGSACLGKLENTGPDVRFCPKCTEISREFGWS
jgi:hypothetical protein